MGGAFQQWWQWCEKQAIFLDDCAQLPHHVLKSIYQFIHMNHWIRTRELCAELNISLGNNSGCTRILQSLGLVNLKNAHRNRKNTVYNFLRICWTSTRLKVTVSWSSLLMTRRGVTTRSLSQNDDPRSDDIWIPHWRKRSGCIPQLVKWCTLPFVIFLDFLEPKQAISSDYYMVTLTKLKARTSRGQTREEQPLSCNMVTVDTILAWRL